jgi:medium-chain acyl-[acyl-carrier-protein] hydrolase
VFETYTYQAGPLLPCPIAAFGGNDDERVSLSDLENWRRHTGAVFSLAMLPGDHFFIHSACRLLVERIGFHVDTVLDQVCLGEDCAAAESS